jgi:hypothetical protein
MWSHSFCPQTYNQTGRFRTLAVFWTRGYVCNSKKTNNWAIMHQPENSPNWPSFQCCGTAAMIIYSIITITIMKSMVSKWHHCYKSCPNQQSVQSGGGKTIENIRLIGGFYFSLSILKIWKSFWIPDQSSCGLSCRIPFPIFSYRTSILLGLLGVFLWLDQSRFRHRGHKEDISRSPCSCQTLLALGSWQTLLVPGSRDAKLVASSKKSVYIIVAARTFNHSVHW